ncbi:adenomatous polyposis coli homolog [Nylanderia fulva]|uniref:adenomatous polyposis coli homolog n=1 Tax=Nylanderia fulva TaxID=613905 RepID=UPI0010FAE1B3|nr:adenomatous polyposis coli homolog [Nylanderia fulva]XP_029165350.1 adenomatous polyposis coli homolog [Nylanderia fulva]XP_029165351.1 adenomatous polyposis coli homolog [Nylanderia fulva]
MDDEDVNDQPVDYSKKYTERNVAPVQNQLIESADVQRPRRASKKVYGERDSKVDPFGDYAETDLDQPTDYSLRYAEDDEEETDDEEEKQGAEYFPVSGQEDTVKTYCTEGTPYETPFNFSTATSMSDLRVEDAKESELLKKMPKKPIEMARKSPVTFIKEPETPDCDEQDGLMTKELEEEVNPKDTAILNPGQVTPEKIVSYYEEETSHGFSRANSLSSLSSAMTSQNNVPGVISKVDSPSPSVNKEELEESEDHSALELNNNQAELSSGNDNLSQRKNTPRVLDKEGKMVTFSGQDYYAEETPLMFSRSSSLGSLSGFEQHSIHDDRSSVVSDFSRRTSGIVSPSELPDSPTQTALPSPRNHKTQNAEFSSKLQEETVRPTVRQHLSFSKPQITINSVFEDEVATFKVESTPVEFSSATSLSSLTIDDEVKIPNDTNMYGKLERVPDEDEEDVHKLEIDMLNVTISNSKSEEKEEQVSDGDEEDDEDMLAACINMGMQTNRYRQSLSKIQHETPTESPAISGTLKTNRTAVDTVASDTVHVYCTEDTPADISPVGSHSNLSALSMPSVQEDVEKIEPDSQDRSAEIDCHRGDLFDEGSNLSGEDEKILDECIQSGIPKARQITLPPTSSIPFVKKSEMSHMINICGTPSSSPVETNHGNKQGWTLPNPGNKNRILRPKSLGGELLSSRHPDEFSDDSLNHSDDDAILTECIQSAMPKARFQPLSQTDNPKMQTSSTSSAFLQPRYTEQRKSTTKKRLPFEDNVGLSEEEEDIMLAQCIRSGMPKALSSMSTTPTLKKSEPCPKSAKNFWAPPASFFTNKVYPKNNAAPHSSPSYKSRNVSGNLNNGFLGTRATSSSGLVAQSGQTSRNCDNETRERINNSPHCTRRASFRHAESENGNSVDDYACKSTGNPVAARHISVSAVGEADSRISTQEWALLELCITSGMPANKYRVKGMKSSESAISNGHDDCEPIPEDNYSVCSYNSYIFKT